MNPKILIALAIASLASSAAAQGTSGTLPDSESIALMEFSQAFQSPVIVWNSSLPLCDQQGITCQQTGENNTLTVTSINLSNAQMSGSIPNSIGDLGNLQTLILSNNLISGTIPNQITDLSSLATLDLSSNQLYGTIPSTITSLQQLTNLNLANNRLAGSFPADFNLQPLQSLYLLGSNGICPYPNYTSVPNNDYQDSSSCQICNGNSCLNGGQCIANQDQSFDCVCPENVSGTFCETAQPTSAPTEQPSGEPTAVPTEQPTDQPTGQPTDQPTDQPTGQPTGQPTDQPTEQPTEQGGQGGQGNSAGVLLAGAAPFFFALGTVAFNFFA